MDILHIGALLFILLAVAGVAVYIYRFIVRIGKNLNITINNKWAKLATILVSIALFWCCVSLFSIGAIALLHFVGLSMLTDIVDYIIKRVKKNRYSELKIWNKLYKICVIPLVLTVGFMVYGYMNMMNIVETSYTIDTEKNIRAEGYRIGLVADIHFGISLDVDEFQKVCDEISSKNIDIMVLCGDIVDEGASLEQMQQVFKMLSSINSKYGTYYVYGNHDRQSYKMDKSYTVEQLNEAITANGIKILADEVVTINDEIILVGRKDTSMTGDTNRVSIEKLLEGKDKDKFILTLDHQPKNYDENVKAGTDLLLSGHTHGGQIWPINMLFEIIKFDDEVYGLTNIGEFNGIVTSGVAGWGFPVKTCAKAEYVIVDVK